MKIDEDKSMLQSSTGSILSILMFAMVILFAYQKTEIWWYKTGMDIAFAVTDQFFDDDF